MHKATSQGFVDAAGHVRRYLAPGPDPHSSEWDRKQEGSIQEYIEHTQQAPDGIAALYRLFDGYIAAAICGQSGLKILDIGCGISRDWPPYTSSIRRSLVLAGNTYVGLDPIRIHEADRAYPFLCARIEELPRQLADRFDIFLFSTSLDHFEDVSRVAAITREMSSEKGIAIFWVGLHDPSLVAEDVGREGFARLFASLNPLAFLFGMARMAVLMLTTYFRLAARQARLRAGQPLDKLHFYYFTQDSIRRHLLTFGEVLELFRVAGTNSIFAIVKIGGKSAT